MANTLKLEIVTPEGKVYSENVEMVTLPGIEGEMSVYPGHVPLMTQLAAGEVIARKDGQNVWLAVAEGFVEVTGESVAILAVSAILAENIEEAKAEEARRRAEARLAEHLNDEEVATVEASLSYSTAQLKVKRHTRH